MLAHHIFDDPIRQAMGFEQLEHLLPEQGFQVGRAGAVGLIRPPFSAALMPWCSPVSRASLASLGAFAPLTQPACHGG